MIAETTPGSIKIPNPSYWGLLLRFLPVPILFWMVQFVLQYYWLSSGEFSLSIIRCSSFTGATLVGAALLSSAIFKWKPRLARHWRIRRYLGVSGFIFIALHVFTAVHYSYRFDYAALFYSFNPFENPIIFGSIAFIILFILAATSTDWAVDRLTPRVWKFIHRFVYIAYISYIFHFSLMNPAALNTPPGYLLILVTALTIFGQLYWFFKIASRHRFRSPGSFVGILLIISTLILIYFVING